MVAVQTVSFLFADGECGKHGVHFVHYGISVKFGDGIGREVANVGGMHVIDDLVTDVVVGHAVDLLLVQVASPSPSRCGVDKGKAVDHFVSDDLLNCAAVRIRIGAGGNHLRVCTGAEEEVGFTEVCFYISFLIVHVESQFGDDLVITEYRKNRREIIRIRERYTIGRVGILEVLLAFTGGIDRNPQHELNDIGRRAECDEIILCGRQYPAPGGAIGLCLRTQNAPIGAFDLQGNVGPVIVSGLRQNRDRHDLPFHGVDSISFAGIDRDKVVDINIRAVGRELDRIGTG